MGVEGHDYACKPLTGSFLNKPLDYRLVPDVDAVESANGKARWMPKSNCFLNVSDYSHLLRFRERTSANVVRGRFNGTRNKSTFLSAHPFFHGYAQRQ